MNKPQCTLPEPPALPQALEMALYALPPERANLIRFHRTRWMNGSTILWAMKGGSSGDRNQIRKTVRTWQRLAPGLKLVEADTWSAADVRIQFVPGGSWSYIGTDCKQIVRREATMSFGWSLTTPWGVDTALHEWGHALGYPHEHQNPNAGIVWDVNAVYEEFTGPPNSWTKDQIDSNILNKYAPYTLAGTDWDRDSIMHYPFEAGLIIKPEEYKTNPLNPKSGLSEKDIAQTLVYYPSLDPTPPDPDPVDPTDPLEPPRPHKVRYLQKGTPVVLKGEAGDEFNFAFEATMGECIKVQTSGNADTMMVLKDINLNKLKSDDDSGFDKNAKVTKWSRKKQMYFVDIRLVWKEHGTEVSVLRT